MIEPEEIWTDVYGFPPYLISNYGRLINSSTGRILKPGAITNSGYISYHLIFDGQRYPKYAHRLVAEAFIACNIESFEVDHLDGDKLNNCVWNLEIVTASVNSQRAYDRGSKIPPSMKKLKIIETGEEFESLSQCARKINRALSSVSYAALNGTPTAGVHVEYI